MRCLLLLLGLFAPGIAPGIVHAQTLQSVRAAHHLSCGTVESADDWNGRDLHGDISRFGTEICRAVSVAMLGPKGAVSVQRFAAEPEALAALRDGTVQLVVGVSPASAVAMLYGIAFGPPVFYDTQRFLVLKASGMTSLADLRDQVVCAMNNTPPERTLREEMTARDIPYGLQAHSEQGEMDASVAVARCAAGTALESRLADSRADFPAAAPQFVFLPERIGLAPIVPAYKYSDQAFGLIVEYTISALIEAEALGITQANVAKARERTDQRAEQLLGHDFAVAQALALEHDWAAQVIMATGNYGEIFQRTLGQPFRLDRGLNALWTDGGLMHPMPMQ